MFFKRSDEDFIQAASGSVERAALLQRLRRARKTTLVFGLISAIIGLVCGVWVVLLILSSVEVMANSAGDASGVETSLNTAISTAQIVKFVILAIVFQLPFTFAHLLRLDTNIKLLLYLEARERIPTSSP